jgi:hypothetical protein
MATKFHKSKRNVIESAGVVVGSDLPVGPIFRRTSEAMFSHRALSKPDTRIAALAQRLPNGADREVGPYHNDLWNLSEPMDLVIDANRLPNRAWPTATPVAAVYDRRIPH